MKSDLQPLKTHRRQNVKKRELKNLRDGMSPEDRIGAWLSAALEDPMVCDEMKQDIKDWFDQIDDRITDFECPRCGHCCKSDLARVGEIGVWLTPEEMERFPALVAKHEREACAKVCDVLAVHPEYASDITKVAAQAIRART